MTRRIVVVGGGIVGAAVAYEAARAGGDVVLIEKALPGSAVTADSFAWIGEPRPGDATDASTALRRTVLRDWRRWESEVPGLNVRWRGVLLCGETGNTDASELEPHLREPPAHADFIASHGAVDPVAVTQALVRAAQSRGTLLLANTAVAALSSRDGRVTGVQWSGGAVEADTVVVAAGVDAPALLRPLGFALPVTPSPALLMRFAAPPGLVRTLVVTPDLEVRESADGELLVADAYRGETDQEGLRHAGEQMRRRLIATFDTQAVQLLGVRLGARPMPADGLPLIGPVPGIAGAYVAVMHSGVTLAPSAGRLIASEIVAGVLADELAGLRPGRGRT